MNHNKKFYDILILASY
jgi:hypothetical protein